MDEVYPPASSFAVGQEPVVLLGHSLGGSIVEARLTVHEGFLAPNSWHVQVLLARKKDAAAKVQGAILLCPVPVMSFCAPAADQTRQTLRKPPGREFTRYLVPSEVQTQSQCSFVQDSQDCTTCCRGTYICFFFISWRRSLLACSWSFVDSITSRIGLTGSQINLDGNQFT